MCGIGPPSTDRGRLRDAFACFFDLSLSARRQELLSARGHGGHCHLAGRVGLSVCFLLIRPLPSTASPSLIWYFWRSRSVSMASSSSAMRRRALVRSAVHRSSGSIVVGKLADGSARATLA